MTRKLFWIQLLVLTAEACAGAGLRAQTFASHGYTAYPAGAIPEDLVTADFNGDGFPDVAVGNSDATGTLGNPNDTVSVLLSRSDGTFELQVEYLVGDRPEGIVAGTFDAGETLDLASADYGSHTVSILLGNGDGTFQAAGGGPVSVGGGPRSVAAGDFNGDGRVDLATANYDADSVSILEGDGTGGFSVARTLSVGRQPEVIAAGSLDSGGTLDLVTCNTADDTVTILHGAGDGTFTFFTDISVGRRPRHVKLFDVDGDGLLDIFTADHTGNAVSILRNVDGTSFAAQPPLVAAGGDGPIYVNLADLDADGLADCVATYARSNNLAVFPGEGDFAFGPGELIPAGATPLGIGIADFDGSGRLDLVISNALDNNLYVYLSSLNMPSYVVDNGDPGTSSTGLWSFSAAAGAYGADSLFAKSEGGTSYTWTAELPEPGDYAVYAWWTATPQRTGGAVYTVLHAAGSSEETVDQRVHGGQWNPLGKYRFEDLATVRLDARTLAFSTCADAVCFVPVSSEKPPPAVEIVTHPDAGRVYAGACCVLSAALSGAGEGAAVSYRWFRDGGEIAGAGEARLVLAPVRTEDAGLYTVRVLVDETVVDAEPVELAVPGRNLALSGTAAQSSVAANGVPARAIDGNTNGVWDDGSVTHTRSEAGAWWQVELFGDSVVDAVVLWNRTDCCSKRLSNFRIEARDSTGTDVWSGEFFTDLTFPQESFEATLPQGTECRAIRIERLGPDADGGSFLSLAEVEVFGTGPLPPPDPQPNLARGCGAVADQSSQSGDAAGDLAVDGDLDTFSQTASGDESPLWWVDFARMVEIGVVAIHNRSDCCGSRLRDITVSIFDANQELVWESELLNPENEMGAFPDGPAVLTVDLQAILGSSVTGRTVCVERTPDPDFSGGGDGLDPEEADVLALTEVEVFGPLCPSQGDTHCGELAIQGPEEREPGTYTVTASATDDSGDEILYTFTADNGVGEPLVAGPQSENTASFQLGVGAWTVSVTVDDDRECGDAAADAACEESIEVLARGIGPFLRGDVDDSGMPLTLTDSVIIFNWLFLGTGPLKCPAAADVNLQGEVNITSGIYILDFLFLGGPPPSAPYPACGLSREPTDIALGCDVAYSNCPVAEGVPDGS